MDPYAEELYPEDPEWYEDNEYIFDEWLEDAFERPMATEQNGR